jgi:hypothetical protein
LNETCLDIVLGEGEEAVESSPHEHQGRHLTDAPSDVSHSQRIGTTAAIMFFPDINLWPFSRFLRGQNTWKMHGDKSGLYVGWSNTDQHVLDIAGHMG